VAVVFLWRRRVVARRSTSADLPVEERTLQADEVVEDGANPPESFESVGER
jgi:hypothetical protein